MPFFICIYFIIKEKWFATKMSDRENVGEDSQVNKFEIE